MAVACVASGLASRSGGQRKNTACLAGLTMQQLGSMRFAHRNLPNTTITLSSFCAHLEHKAYVVCIRVAVPMRCRSVAACCIIVTMALEDARSGSMIQQIMPYSSKQRSPFDIFQPA
jgi:hypothetical protein